MKKKTNTLNKTLLFLCLLLLTSVSKSNTVYAGFGTPTECENFCQSWPNNYCVKYLDSWNCTTGEHACSSFVYCPEGTHCVPDISSGNLPQCVADNGGSASLGKRFDLAALSVNFFKIAFPFAVILGFINIISAGYVIMASEGDPRRVNEGKEKLTAAIMGLLYVLLTIAILRIILGTLISGGGVGF